MWVLSLTCLEIARVLSLRSCTSGCTGLLLGKTYINSLSLNKMILGRVNMNASAFKRPKAWLYLLILASHIIYVLNVYLWFFRNTEGEWMKLLILSLGIISVMLSINQLLEHILRSYTVEKLHSLKMSKDTLEMILLQLESK